MAESREASFAAEVRPMTLNKRTNTGLLLAALITALIGGGVVKRPVTTESHINCQVAVAQDPGQEPGQEEGNPGHRRPEQNCSHKPTKKQVNCHCKTDCNPDGTQQEDTRCRSYCHKDMCSCPRTPCA
jgi:hypothetical protein